MTHLLILSTLIVFVFPSLSSWELFFFNGGLSFFCVSHERQKVFLCSRWHATVCQWLTQRRNVQWNVDLLSVSSKESSPTSFPLICRGTPVICSLEANHKRILIDFWSLSVSCFLFFFTPRLIHDSRNPWVLLWIVGSTDNRPELLWVIDVIMFC